MDKTVSVSWQEKVKYGPAGPDPQILADDGQMRVILGGLQAGQSIPAHPEAKAVYQFLQGDGLMFVDDQTFPVSPGTVIVVPEGAKCGMQAATQLAFLAVRVS